MSKRFGEIGFDVMEFAELNIHLKLKMLSFTGLLNLHLKAINGSQ